MNRRRLAVLAVLAGAVTAPACLTLDIGQAHAAACGGNSTVRPAPVDCTNTKTIQGVTGTVHLTVDNDGFVQVSATISPQPPAPMYLQVKVHDGISSEGGFNGNTDVFENGQAFATAVMPGCLSQIDIKIVPGQPTLAHVSSVFRIAAPLVSIICNNTPTTTTAPSTTVTTTTVVVTTTVPGKSTSSTATTSAPSSSPPTAASSGTIPATGGYVGNLIGYAFLLIIPGTLAVIIYGSRRRAQ